MKFLDIDGLALQVDKIKEKLTRKLNKNQGVEHVGDFMIVDESGDITPSKIEFIARYE